MANPKCIEVNGRLVPWRELLKRRKEQLATVAKAEQPVLFALREDSRPVAERTAADRYREPSLLAFLTREG
ncbi:MAG: hypothetical protein HQL37_12775 [Alphaproteobacteria bacterium]|nr:hypothetical protein [Alphaproteobacteria bacterium]